MQGIYDWEGFRRAQEAGKAKIIWGEGPLISIFAKQNELRLPLVGKKKRLIELMLIDETVFERVHNTYDIYEM